MINAAQDAYLKSDVEALRHVMTMDDDVDVRYKEIQADLFAIMATQPAMIARAQSFIWVAHNLERLGDRITNVCERIIYVVTGDLHDLKGPSLTLS